jgi:glycerol-3-phosphate acyltransferase PlsY
LSWPVGAVTCAAWLLLAALFRYSSLATLGSIAVGAIAAWFIVDWPIAAAVTALVPLVWLRHHANIRRLLDGSEPKIGQRKADASPAA